jgi:hypothetical protein
MSDTEQQKKATIKLVSTDDSGLTIICEARTPSHKLRRTINRIDLEAQRDAVKMIDKLPAELKERAEEMTVKELYAAAGDQGLDSLLELTQEQSDLQGLTQLRVAQAIINPKKLKGPLIGVVTGTIGEDEAATEFWEEQDVEEVGAFIAAFRRRLQ